jgi:hypothetical protein
MVGMCNKNNDISNNKNDNKNSKTTRIQGEE